MDLAMIIAGTGHRPDKLGGYDPHTMNQVFQFAERVLSANKPTEVISGMALGWDMALAQAAVNLGIPFRAYIPFVGQEQVWPSATRLYYKALLARAQETKICSTGGYTKASMQIRNQNMVDDCDVVAALWNGSDGGTSNCLSYAMFVGKPYINYWPQFIMAIENPNIKIELPDFTIESDALKDWLAP
jgi:uncharacterized phage-like protein YoqJ